MTKANVLTKANIRAFKLNSISLKVAFATTELTAALDSITKRKPNQTTSNGTKDINFINPPAGVSYQIGNKISTRAINKLEQECGHEKESTP